MLTCNIKKHLRGFDLNVEFTARDQVLALFGPSGSGKSLTLQCIAGLLTPDEGFIQVGDQTLFDSRSRINLPPRRRRVGYVFQNYALFPHLSAAENIGYGLSGLSRAERAARVQEALRTVRLESLGDRRPAQLSGGQQQRVALARALVTRPSVLLLDEPFAALDSIVRAELHHELVHLLRELSIPTLLVTHQLDEAYALSREIAVYEAGHVLQFGPRDEVFYHPRSRETAHLVGMVNNIPGTVVSVAAGLTEIAGPGGLTLWGPAGPYQPGQRVECCIRPEHVMLLRKDRPASPPLPGETRLEGEIVEEVAYGGYVSLVFRPDAPAGEAAAAGAGVAGPLPDLRITLADYMQKRLDVGRSTRQTLNLKSIHTHILTP